MGDETEGSTLVADAGGADPAAGLPSAWHAVLIVEGLRTTDNRAWAPNSLTWRDLPLPLMGQFETAYGHDEAKIVGRIDAIVRNGNAIEASGIWDLESEHGREAARLCAEQILRFVSCDMEVIESEYVEVISDPIYDDWGDLIGGDFDWYEEIVSCRIGMATMLTFPVFPQAVIAPEGVDLPVVEPMGEQPGILPGLLAAGAPVAPPAFWFDDPALEGPTPLTVTDDGRVFGHAATWGTCHTGMPNTCTTAPRSASGYAYFRTGVVQCAADAAGECRQVPVGHITVATGHAGLSLTHRAAAAHYDDTGTAVADVAAGEDAHGVWVAGALRPGVTDEQIRVLRASSLSGDWRTVGGALDLVALLAVNVPGFPIVRGLAASGRPAEPVTVRAGLDHGHQISLVAAGLLRTDPVGDALVEIRGQLAELRGVVAELEPLARERVSAAFDAA